MFKTTGAAEPAAVADSSAQDVWPAQNSPVKPAANDDRRTTDAWGLEYFPPSASGRIHDDLWKHAAASQLHGWGSAIHHTGAPLSLSRADYEAALAAVSGTTLEPHAPALFVLPKSDTTNKGAA